MAELRISAPRLGANVGTRGNCAVTDCRFQGLAVAAKEEADEKDILREVGTLRADGFFTCAADREERSLLAGGGFLHHGEAWPPAPGALDQQHFEGIAFAGIDVFGEELFGERDVAADEGLH
jgi:hypothetical protein